MNRLLKLRLFLATVFVLGFAACSNIAENGSDASKFNEPTLESTATQSISVRIAKGADDTEEVADGTMYAPSTRLEIVDTGDRGMQKVGLRFTNVNIPKGATITSADIHFTADKATSGYTGVSVRGLRDAKPFPTTNGYLSGASTTSERIIWKPEPWTEVSVRDAYSTDDLSNVVQELIEASSWQSGNAMAFVISGGEGDRVAESYERHSSESPLLHIRYTTGSGGGSSSGTRIIFDSDYGFDVDDVGALAVLNVLENKGEANILAVMAEVTDTNTPGAMDAVNTYYGNPNIPIGRNKVTPPGSDWDEACTYWRVPRPCRDGYIYFVDNLVQEFPNSFKSESDVNALPSAVSLYRKTLASQPDNSVTIVAVGFMKNLADLLNSGADGYSSLSGVQLVDRKVKQLVIMGASYSSGDGDFNLTGGKDKDASFGQRVFTGWPTTIAFTPGNSQMCGGSVSAGETLSSQTPKSNPVRRAYEVFNNGPNRGRTAWDLCSVLYAVRGTNAPDGERYFNVYSGKKVVLNNDLSHRWVSDSGTLHKRVWREGAMSESRIEAVLNGLLTQSPQ